MRNTCARDKGCLTLGGLGLRVTRGLVRLAGIEPTRLSTCHIA